MARVDVDGEDGRRFINGMVTCDVKSLAPGGGALRLLYRSVGTRARGCRGADGGGKSLAGAAARRSAEGIVHHLEKYIIADRVELKRADDCLAPTLVGARALDFWQRWLRARSCPQAPWAHGEVGLLGRQLRISADQGGGFPPFTLWPGRRGSVPGQELLAADTGVGSRTGRARGRRDGAPGVGDPPLRTRFRQSEPAPGDGSR